MFGDMGKLMKQVTEMKAKMGAVEKELKGTILTGVSRDGTVKAEITGKMVLNKIEITDELIADKKRVEKAVFEAVDAALKNASEEAKKRLSGVTGGLNIPGL